MAAWMFPAMGAGAAKAFGSVGAAKLGLGGIGGFLGGAGMFAGGMADIFGKSGHVDRDAIRRNQMWMWQNQLPMIAESARKAGISPLVAIGMTPQSTPMFARDDRPVGRGLQRIGQGLQRMTDVGMSEIQKAQIANINADTRYKNRLADQVGRDAPHSFGDITGAAGDPGIRVTPKEQTAQRVAGSEQGAAAAWTITWDPQGFAIVAPSKNLQEYATEGMGVVEFGLSRLRQSLNNVISSFAPWSNMAKRQFKKTRVMLDKFEMIQPAGPNHYWIWSFEGLGGPRRVRKNKYKKQQLFDDRKGPLSKYHRHWGR